MSVKRIGIDIDSDQQIMGATITKDGKWQFLAGDEVIAEAAIPPKVDMNVVSQWCGVVRSRIQKRSEIDTEEILARKKARREGYAMDDSSPSRSGDGTVPDTEVQSVHPPNEVGGFDEDPEQYALNRWKELSERQTALEAELHKVKKLALKWQAIAAAAQEND